MRLLDVNTWRLHDFDAEESRPQYAILSHIWGKEEVTYKQWEKMSAGKLDVSTLEGYRKIRQFGDKARQDGFEWVWIDT